MDAERWRRITEALGTVLDLPSGMRERWLEEATLEDPSLLAEVRGLLAAYEGAGDRFEHGALGAAPELQSELRTAMEGLRIGPYRILSELGRGGMGAVYLAVRDDAEGFAQKVAVKLIKRGMDTEAIVRRFLHERRILAGLSHPNIARLYDGGTALDGRPYFVMEHVEGRPLRAFAEAEGLGIEARLRLILKVCSAVQFAHQNLVIHRDLKPANILVGADSEPKLLDFGIAKLLDQSSSGDERGEMSGLTAVDHRPMTPDYASPEQSLGEPVTTATDVYSLGVILYELLAGKTPAAVERYLGSSVGSSVGPRISGVSGWSHRPPSQALLALTGDRRASRRLAGDLDTIVGKALERSAERRYGTAAALAEDLERHLSRRPVLARRPTLAYRLGRAVVRHKLASAFVLSVVLLMGALGAQTLFLIRQNAQTARQKARAEDLAGFLIDLFRIADPGESRGEAVTARDILSAAERRLLGASEPSLEPASRSDLLRAIGEVRTHLGLYDDAEAILDKALALRAGQAGADAELDRAETLTKLGILASERGDYARSRRFYAQALASKRRLSPAADPSLVEDLNGLGLAATEGGDLAEAAAYLAEAAAIGRRAGARGRDELAISWNNQGNLHLAKEDYAAAETFFRRALTLDQQTLGKDHPESLRVQNNLARVLRLRGDPGAAALYRDLLAVQRRVLGPAHLHLALTLGNLAVAELDQGHTAAAEAALHESEAIRRHLHQPPDLDEANTLNTLAGIQYEKGDLDAADESYQKSFALYRKLRGTPAELANALRGLALVRQGRRDLPGAEKLVRESLALLSGAGNAELDTAGSWYFLAEIQRASGRPREAEASYREALALHLRILGADHPAVGADQLRLGSLLLEGGRAAEAEPLLAHGLATRRKAAQADPVQMAKAAGLLGECRLRLGRRESAGPLLESSFQTLQRLLGPGHADTRTAAERLRRLRLR
jgi:eukaryotic-like serine/threonine-protein kinase